jgi:hypothetical protein
MKTESSTQRSVTYHLVCLMLGVAVYLYLNLFSFPHTPFLLSGDQAFFWMRAQRMLDGDRIYRDFIQFTAPGTDLVYLSLFRLFGLHLWVTNAVVLALGIGLCWACFALASEIMNRRSAVLATAFFLVLIYGKLLNGTHHLFSVLAIMGAVKIYMRKITPSATVVAGAFLGTASFFTQTHGGAALLAFAVFLIWRQSREKRPWFHLIRKESLLFLGYSAALLMLSAPLIDALGWKQLWYSQVTYTRQYVVPMRPPLLGLPGPFTLRGALKLSQAVFVYLFLPTVYLLTLWRCWRERHAPTFPWERITLLSLVGFFLMVEVSFSLNWLRLYAVSLAGVILLIWCIDQARKIRPYAVAAMWIGITCLAVWQTIAAYAYQPRKTHLPAGEVAVSPLSYEKLHWMMEHTRPEQFVFQAAWPGIYLPLQLRNPVFVDQILPGDGTRQEEVTLTIRQLEEKQVPYVLWAARLGSMDNLAVRQNDHVVPLRAYLHSHYSEEHTFPDGDQVWQRNESTSSP